MLARGDFCLAQVCAIGLVLVGFLLTEVEILSWGVVG